MRDAQDAGARPEKLRRRVRARMLNALTAAAGTVPPALVHGALRSLAPLARFTRFERVTLDNLDRALGREMALDKRRRIARGVRCHSARLLSEWIRLAHSRAHTTVRASRGELPQLARSTSGEWIDRAVVLDASIAILERKLARGRGALVVTAHIGNWELLCARLLRHGLTGAVVGFERPGDSSARWLTSMRRAYGVTTLMQHTHPREILRTLARGETIGLLADLEVRRLDGEFLPFFGIPALTMTAPAALARAAHVPLIPVRCVLSGDVYRLSVEEPLELDRKLERREATLDLLARMNAVFERWIREHPEQWCWHQPRWRTAPGEFESVPIAARPMHLRAARASAASGPAPD